MGQLSLPFKNSMVFLDSIATSCRRPDVQVVERDHTCDTSDYNSCSDEVQLKRCCRYCFWPGGERFFRCSEECVGEMKRRGKVSDKEVCPTFGGSSPYKRSGQSNDHRLGPLPRRLAARGKADGKTVATIQSDSRTSLPHLDLILLVEVHTRPGKYDHG
jgi:hypothetical protein